MKNMKWVWVRIFLALAFSAVVLLNSLDIRSPFVGIPASIAFIYISSVATGEILFSHEKRFFKQVLGLASFLLIMTLLGVLLILIAEFTEILSLVSLITVGLGLCVFSGLKKGVHIQSAPELLEGAEPGKKKSYLLVFPFLLFSGIAFYALMFARTGEGQVSVWQYIPDFFLPSFFLSTLSLVIVLFFTKMKVGLKLAFISLYSFLSHSVFLLVWYPGRYGDPWSFMGNARFVDETGTFYAYNWLFSNRLIADIVKYESQFGLVVFFRRMFSLDIYWIHVFFIPLLWSIFVPIFSYKIAELFAVKKTTKFPLLSAVAAGLFSTLVYTGAVSTTFSLGVIFLFFLIMLLLYWVDTHAKRFLFLSFLVSLAALFAHPPVGIFAFGFLFVVIILQSKLHSILKIAFFITIAAAFPYASYLQGGRFSQEGFLNPQSILSFQFNITTLLLPFGFLGLVLGARGKLMKGKSALTFFLFYVILAADYYIVMYGMINATIPDRLPFIMDVLLMPFVAVGLLLTANFLKASFSNMNPHPLKNTTSRTLSILMICLFLSAQATFALYQAYPRQEITEVQPAGYEVEAVRYVDSTAPGRYVVLGDTNLASVAGGLLGIDYCYGASSAKGSWGTPEWDWWSEKLYQEMAVTPSLEILQTAITTAGADSVYFIVSVREGPNYFPGIVQRVSQLLPVEKVFGGGKLFVFRYPFEGSPQGPTVKVVFDDGTSQERNVFARFITTNEVNYTVNFWGHSSYNISDYPKYWTFLRLTVDGVDAKFDPSSDINTFIFIAGLKPKNTLTVTWHANRLYSTAGWKDDSFKEGWQTRLNPQSTISPNIASDGNILSLSWNFTPGGLEYYYYVKNVPVATNDYPYIFVKWKSTAPIAYFTISYENGEERAIVPTNSLSLEWTVTSAKLLPNTSTSFVTIGIYAYHPPYTDEVSGSQAVFIDYILICGLES